MVFRNKALSLLPIAALAITLLAGIPCMAFADTGSEDLMMATIEPSDEDTAITQAESAAEPIDMYRLYNPNSGEHFYTANADERNHLVSVGWRYEGTGWIAPSKSNTPVYRLYSGTDHHYTMSEQERDWLVEQGWSYEGIGWYSDDGHTVALLRVFNPNVDPQSEWNNSGSHHFTTSAAERDGLTQVGWHAEGLAWYALEEGTPSSDWVSTLQLAQSGTVSQIITVEARDLQATVTLHELINGEWNATICTNEGWVGKDGIGQASAYTAHTPTGVMYPTEAFGIQANPGCPMGYLQVDDSHYWCGDSSSSLYNLMVSTRDRTDFDIWESEHIISCGETYNYCLNMGWNINRIPYGGSAFFLHCSQGRPTDGCVTVPEATMIQILQAVRPGCAIVIDTPSGMSNY